jgi:hypothetical protein
VASSEAGNNSLAEPLVAIGEDCALRLNEPFRSSDHAELLSDEHGTPQPYRHVGADRIVHPEPDAMGQARAIEAATGDASGLTFGSAVSCAGGEPVIPELKVRWVSAFVLQPYSRRWRAVETRTQCRCRPD